MSAVVAPALHYDDSSVQRSRAAISAFSISPSRTCSAAARPLSLLYNVPSANACWGRYLRSIGYRRYIVPDTCPDCYTVGQFAEDHPEGTYILALSGHVVCVCDGMIWDSWDSSNENILYYWVKEDD